MVWRGGRPFKTVATEPEKKQAPPKGNGTSTNVISLDSDDEDTPEQQSSSYVDEPVFEDLESEHNPSQPYEPIIQTLELPLGTQILHLSVPTLPSDLHSRNFGFLPKMLLDKLLIAAACADSSVRLLTLPLLPPSPKSKSRPELRKHLLGAVTGNGFFGEQMLVLSGTIGHNSIPRGISVTLTSPTVDEVYNPGMNDPVSQELTISRTSSIGRGKSHSRDGRQDKKPSWDLLVASHSADFSGLLLIHRIPFVSDGSGINFEDSKTTAAWRSQHLGSPAVSLHFNGSLYPASRHSQLLLANSSGIVRVFDCQPHSRADQGSWVISIYSDYELLRDNVPKRKQILASQWVLDGKAIVVLLSDGEWGIWDLEDKAPNAKQDLEAWQAPVAVDLSKFAVTGRVNDLREAARSSAPTASKSRLAPMTPGTRRSKQKILFAGPTTKAASPARGGISILPASDGLDQRADEETLLIWHGDAIMIVPSLPVYWQNRVKGCRNFYEDEQRGQTQELNDIQLGGEWRNDVSLIPQRSANATTNQTSKNSVLITAEHRFVIVAPPLTETPCSATLRRRKRSEALDQALLAQGDLDMDGIENMLNNIAYKHVTNGASGSGITPKVTH